MIPLKLQVFAAGTLLSLLGWVAVNIRNRRLSLRDSLSWFLSTLAALAVTIFPRALAWVAHALSIEVPANALFAFAFLYVLGNLFWLTTGMSRSAAHIRRLVQECALLQDEIQTLRSTVADAGIRPK